MIGSDAAPVGGAHYMEAIPDVGFQDLQDSVLSQTSRQQQHLPSMASASCAGSSSSGDEGSLPRRRLRRGLAGKNILTEEQTEKARKEKRDRKQKRKYLAKLQKERDAIRGHFHNKYYWHTYCATNIPDKGADGQEEAAKGGAESKGKEEKLTPEQ